MSEFAGRTALVTGAAGGIGSAVVRSLADAGATVAAADIDGVSELVGKSVHGYRLDVRDPRQIEAVLAAIGPVDVLVNAAGVLLTGPAISTEHADWQAMFAVNVHGVFAVSTAVARDMIPRGSGVIITVSSNAAGIPRMDMAGYAASKAAATSFTKSLGLELAGHGIRCNVVAPGSTDTPMLRGIPGHDARQTIAGSPETFKVGIPLGRLASPEDIADAVLFLASDRARHITMHDLYVDGGATLR